MALVLRLRRQVLLPTVWLSRGEWNRRFRRAMPAFTETLDASAVTVLEDLGGFASLVEDAAWTSALAKTCPDCGQSKSIDEFRIQRSHGRDSAFNVRPLCRGCDAKRALRYRRPIVAS